MTEDTLNKRFWSKVAVAGPNECWNWTACKNQDGYGRIVHDGKVRRAHRMALTISGSPEPFRDANAMHSCDNPSCVNPAHLSWGTRRENMVDSAKKGRNAMTILTPAAVQEIRSSTLMQKELAAKYGVTQTTISHVVRGKNWKHLDG